jgi:hypothetical protein
VCTIPINVQVPCLPRCIVLGTLAVAVGGCVAQIHEDRFYGEPRPAPDARPETVVERRPSNNGALECREVTVSAAELREVDIRRTFADQAQGTNFALVTLLGTGIGLVAYGQDKVQCPEHGGQCSAPTYAGLALLGLAAVPLGLIAYNALAARDRRVIERVLSESTATPWGACATR